MVLVLALSLLFLFGCQSLERDNVYDPYGSNYIGGISSVAESSSSSSSVPSSSIAEPSSSSSSVPSSSIAEPSSSSVRLSSSVQLSSSSVAAITGCGSTETHYCSDGATKLYGKLTDSRDDREYKTLVIGGQEWMAENLRYDGDTGSRYTVGKCIPASGDKLADSDCLNARYGRLYDWRTAMDLVDEETNWNNYRYGTASCGVNCYVPFLLPHKGVCPQGWHLPTNAEWDELLTAVGGASTAGSKLKATSGWDEGNGTDDYGFSALPGGYGYYGGSIEDGGYWWSSTEGSATSAYYRLMYYDDSGVGRSNGSKSSLFSVRCLRDN